MVFCKRSILKAFYALQDCGFLYILQASKEVIGVPVVFSKKELFIIYL